MRYLLFTSSILGIMSLPLPNRTFKRIFHPGQLLLILTALIYRGILAERLPGIGMLETLMLFSFSLSLISVKLKKENQLTIAFSSLISMLLVFMPMRFYHLPNLMPALRSPLFTLHVPLFFLAYAFLCRDYFRIFIGKIPSFHESTVLFGIGIISGGIWAQIAWGRFWSWDPKESWALITWLILIIGLHVHNPLLKKVIAVFSFLAMLFTFFGIAYLFKGLHSYL